MPKPGELFDALLPTEEELKEQKNNLFREILTSNLRLHSSRKKMIARKTLIDESEIILFEMGIQKSRKLKDKNLNERIEDDFPTVLVAVNNDRDHQTLAISRNKKAFASSNAVINILEQKLDLELRKKHLRLKINPILEENSIWVLFHEYENRITKITY